MNICIASDEAYFDGLYCTVASLIQSAAEAQRITFYILDGGIAESSWKRLERACRADGVALKKVMLAKMIPDGLLDGPNGSLMTYARLLMPSLLDCSRVLYLDADLLVLSDVLPVWNELEESSAPVLAVPDIETPIIGKDCPELCRLMEISEQQVYFNAGVLGCNLDLWRERNIQDTSINLLKEHLGQYRFHDQSVLNLLMGSDVQFIAEKWNVPYWKFDDAFFESSDVELGGIMHYTRYKPWLTYFGTPAYYLFLLFAGSVECKQSVGAGTIRKSRIQWGVLSSTAWLRSMVFYLRSYTRSNTDIKRSDRQVSTVWRVRFVRWCRGINKSRLNSIYEAWTN